MEHQENIMKMVEDSLLQAGEAIMNFYSNSSVLSRKDNNPHMIVTQADLSSQEIIIKNIQAQFPESTILAEEQLHDQDPWVVGKGMYWYIDPLDGTRNFQSKTHLFGVNIACAVDGVLEVAGIYLPATKELCISAKGKGSHLNGMEIHCSQTALLSESYGIGPIRPSGKNATPFLKALQNKYPSGDGPWMNGLGSPAVAGIWVADGRRDWYVSHGSNIWDYAAPALIMQEAGCLITDIHGENWKLGHRSLVASNQYIHKELLGLFL